MMVPEGGDNYVRLVGGAGFDVQPAKPAHHIRVNEVKTSDRVNILKNLTATVPKEDRLFRVHGQSAGPATIIAKKGTDSTKIEVSVKKKKSYSVAFFFLQDIDAKGAARTRSIFSAADTDGWVKGLNDVFGLQANLWFAKVNEKDGVSSLPIAQLPEAVGPDEAKALLEQGIKVIKSADIKIFLAGPKITVQDNQHASHINGFYHVEQKIIIMKDRSAESGKSGNPLLKTMAHEIGHWLNYNHGPGQGHEFYKEVGYPSDILNTMDPSDIKIPHQRVLDWNGS